MKPRWLGMKIFEDEGGSLILFQCFALGRLLVNDVFAFGMLCLHLLVRCERSWSIVYLCESTIRCDVLSMYTPYRIGNAFYIKGWLV